MSVTRIDAAGRGAAQVTALASVREGGGSVAGGSRVSIQHQTWSFDFGRAPLFGYGSANEHAFMLLPQMYST